MSDSNRSRYVAIGLASLALLTVAFGYGVYSYWLGNLSGYKEAETKHYQTEYSERTTERIAGCFDGVDPPRECVEEAIGDNYEQQRAESDLNAQRNMADWAFWLLVVSAAGFGVTTIGTCFLGWQVMLTRKAVEDTGKGTDAMVAANEIARDNLIAAHRAWLKVHVEARSKLKITGDIATLPVRIRAENVGAGIAKNVRLFAYITSYDPADYGDDDVLQRANFGTHGTQFSQHVFPQGVLNVEINAQMLSIDQFLKRQKELAREHANGLIPLYLIAFADYRLPFDEESEPRRITETITEIHGPNRHVGFPMGDAAYSVSLFDSALGSGNVT